MLEFQRAAKQFKLVKLDQQLRANLTKNTSYTNIYGTTSSSASPDESAGGAVAASTGPKRAAARPKQLSAKTSTITPVSTPRLPSYESSGNSTPSSTPYTQPARAGVRQLVGAGSTSSVPTPNIDQAGAESQLGLDELDEFDEFDSLVGELEDELLSADENIVQVEEPQAARAATSTASRTQPSRPILNFRNLAGVVRNEDDISSSEEE